MSIKRAFSLLGIAFAACVLAAPAVASAAVWKDAGVPLKKQAKIFLFGGEVIEVGLGTGVSCATEATLTMTPGSTGQITEFRLIEEACTGFGELAECEVVAASAQNMPWDVHVNATDLTFTGVKVSRVFDPGCPIEELESKVPQLTVTLETPAAIAEMETFGSGVARIEPGTVEAELVTFGAFQVNPLLAGTYGIG